jgi:hypothetical protein
VFLNSRIECMSAVAMVGDISWYVGVLRYIVACIGAYKWRYGGAEGGKELSLYLMLLSLSKIV